MNEKKMRRSSMNRLKFTTHNIRIFNFMGTYKKVQNNFS